MTRIAGAWDASPELARASTAAMAGGAEVTTFRGGFASTTRGAHSALPPDIEGGAVALTGDIRLDNRGELAAALRLPPGVSDLGIVLAAYMRWGTSCAAKLIGDFAFAVYDGRQPQLCLVRDPFGVRPLHYSLTREGIAFASDVATLLRLPGVNTAADERAIVDYLGGFPEDESRSAFRGIQRVPPGTILIASRGRVASLTYWSPGTIAATRPASDAEAAEAVRFALREAVAARLPEGQQVGVLLSGGLDSSAVACLAADELARRSQHLHTLSATFRRSDAHDERGFQRAVGERTGAHAVTVSVATANAWSIDEALGWYREPMPVGGQWLVEPLVRAASTDGIAELLTGVDGDRVVSHGQGRLAELARQSRWTELASELTRVDRGPLAALRQFAALAAVSRLPAPIVQRFDELRGVALRGYAPALRLVRPDVLRRFRVRERLRETYARPWSAHEHHVRALLRADRTADLAVFHGLERAYGIGFAHPFFHRPLVELCVGLPSRLKLHRGVSRLVLRNAMLGVLPEVVRGRRDKAHFDDPFAAWATRVLEGHMRTNGMDFSNLEPYVDVRRLAVPRRPGPDALPVDLLWRCVVASRWLERYALSQPPQETLPVSIPAVGRATNGSEAS